MTAGFLTRWQRTAATIKGRIASQRRIAGSTRNFFQSPRRRIFLTAALVVTTAGASHSLWSGEDFDNYPGQSVGLDHYSLLQAPIELGLLTSNASGISYNPDTNTLFAISNSPTYMVELDKRGRELRKITLDGFHDTEDLTYLGQGRFAVVEERRRSVAIVHIDAHTQSVNRTDSRSITLPAVNGENNKGFEGIAYDPVAQSLFVVNEDEPRQLFRIDGFVDPEARQVTISHPWDMEDNTLGKRDLSGVHFDLDTGHLLVLSDDSHSLTESTLTGEVVSRLSLSGSFWSRSRAGLDHHVPQAEGVAMDDEGQLYILSEPNLLYLMGSNEANSPAPEPQSRVVQSKPVTAPAPTGQKNPS